MAKHTLKILRFSHRKIFKVCLAIFQHYEIRVKEHLYHPNLILSFSESINSLFNLIVPPGDIVKAYILFDALLNNL